MIGRAPTSIAEVVESGLCIGCGLCEALAEGVSMTLTAAGSLRPAPVDAASAEEVAAILDACPGTVARPRPDADATTDAIWGGWRSMHEAWAADDDTRFRSATGGVLTALGMHLVESGAVDAVLQIRVAAHDPLRNDWVLNRTAADVLSSAGSRYGPTAPLAGLGVALDAGRPFAVIAKPCDLGAIHALAATDPRIDELCTHRLAMVCGGQSRLSKSLGLLDDLGVERREVALFRYRGHGNPGPTRIETADGRAFERTYGEMWADEATWDLEPRCTVCPDPLGEAADVAALDIWPGGTPVGEDDGFNGLVVRTHRGADLVAAAVAADRLVLGDPLTPAFLSDTQPHQVRKKVAVVHRMHGRADADLPNIATGNLRLEALGQHLDEEAAATQREGARRRARSGRYSEVTIRARGACPGAEQ